MSVKTVEDALVEENAGVDLVAEHFTYTKCVNGDVVVSFFGESDGGLCGGPISVRIPKHMRRDLEMIL